MINDENFSEITKIANYYQVKSTKWELIKALDP